jgi:hypothetical protein
MRVKMMLVPVMVITLLASVLPGWLDAQVIPAVKATVPFSFWAGDRLMPAGSYQIGRMVRFGNTLRFDYEGSRAMLLSGNCKARDNAELKLVFRRYSTSYFLTDVWMEGVSATCRKAQWSASTRQCSRTKSSSCSQKSSSTSQKNGNANRRGRWERGECA